MFKPKKNAPIIFDGYKAEQYKRMKNKWIRINFIGSVVPFLFAILISLYNDTFNLLELFGKGEIILSLFSINTSLAYDLFEMKKKDDENLSWAFWGCFILLCFQALIYAIITTNTTETVYIKSIISSSVMTISTWLCCSFCIKAMYKHSILDNDDEVGEKNVA